MRHSRSASFRRGTSLVGLLVTVACMVVLAVILMQALSQVKGVGAGGGGAPNTVTNFADRENLRGLFQGLAIDASGGALMLPSRIASGSKSLDTTANFYSAMIAKGIARPSQFITHSNTESSFVNEMEGYNLNAYNPMGGQYWDPNFKADLNRESHASFAHMPLLGERLRRYWSVGASSTFPVLGNRGPLNGIPDPNSWTCDPNTGQWMGNLVFADGHVEYVQSMTPPNVAYQARGQYATDNIFALEDGFLGVDAMLTFTRSISDQHFEMQHD